MQARGSALLALSVAVLIGALLPPGAHAFSSGITGFSGRNGQICNACHGGGAVPTVRIEGPAEVAADSTTTFRFVVESTAPGAQTAAGLDIAATAGTLGTVSGQGTRLSLNELTHSAPKANDGNGVASFEFTWRAPATMGSQTLFAAGNSVNLNRNSTGDRAAGTTHVVAVIAPGPSQTPTATETPPSTATAADTATPTPSPTAMATASPTASNTPRATRTPTGTPLPGRCSGDCDADGAVTVNELVRGVLIALGTLDLADCRNADPSGDSRVTIDEMLQAVRSARAGCGAPPSVRGRSVRPLR